LLVKGIAFVWRVDAEQRFSILFSGQSLIKAKREYPP
jgi:hypothetical protein